MGSRHSEAEWRHATPGSVTPAQARKRLASSRASRNGTSAEAEFDAAAAKWPDTCLATCGPIYKRVSKTRARPVGKATPHVDRVGVIAGVPVCVEIKSTVKDRWNPTLDAFPAHERAFMASWAKSGGLSLLLVRLGPFPHVWRLAEVGSSGALAHWHPTALTAIPAVVSLLSADIPVGGADACKVSP